MDNKTNQELQSLTFERLFNHLRERKDVQNIDLMNLSWFCKTVYLNDIREHVYGMPYSEWKKKYQK